MHSLHPLNSVLDFAVEPAVVPLVTLLVVVPSTVSNLTLLWFRKTELKMPFTAQLMSVSLVPRHVDFTVFYLSLYNELLQKKFWPCRILLHFARLKRS